MTISSWILYALTVAICLLARRITAQDSCACSPSQYLFTLDFSLSCPPVNVTIGSGIEATFCQVSPFGDADQQIEDLVPVTVEYVDLLELSQTFQVLSQQNISGSFEDGDTFSYTSIVDQVDNEEIPKVLQLNIFAFNAEGQPIVNFFAISFSNNCGDFRTIDEGGSAGWTHFTSLEPPNIEMCPGYPTDAPTAIVTDPVTIEPTPGPSPSPVIDTPAPVDPETPAPFDPETQAPVDPETQAPVDPNTQAPVDPETPAPVDPGTPPPTESDVIDPTESPTMFMSMDIDVMSMVMSMPATFRNFDLELKAEKESKSYKDEKKTKYEKYEKSGKSDKAAKDEKSAKADKAGKYEKKEKRRRLRVRPIYEV